MISEMRGDFVIYTWGACHASVCTSLSLEDAEKRVNQELPTGIDSRWKKSKEPFRGGEPNPCPCPDAETHKHYLFNC